MSVRLSFHGAAECVTGFCARIETQDAAVLVDCGMFQGPKTLKALNYGAFPFDPGKVDAVLLTHAHLDHAGLLPKLAKADFEGPIFATAATRDLARILLADAGEIQESDVQHLNRRNERRGRPVVEPIYTARDAAETMRQFRTVKLADTIEVAPGVTARYWPAGHILGSASVEVVVQDADGPVRLLFSGDLGPGGREFAPAAERPGEVDHMILESTYGDRERTVLTPEQRRELLAAEVLAAHAAGGPLLCPTFAVERAQQLLADLLALMETGAVPDAPIFLDSPLAIEATQIFLERGWNADTGLNPYERLRNRERLRFLDKPWESGELDRLSGWHVILAGSGMCDAGRVRKHLKRLLWRREATVMLTGFQAAGTLGRLLAEGRKAVRVQGEDVRVRARIRTLDAYSGHADANGLVRWATAPAGPKGKLFLAHGEPGALAGLRGRLAAAGVPAEQIVIPAMDDGFALQGVRADRAPALAPRLDRGLATAPDWHNARAELLGDLEERLEAAGDDAARLALIRRLETLLAERAA